MGPPLKSSVVPPPPRRCLLCRRDALSPAAQNRANVKLKSYAISLCTIFGLPDTHPFKIIYERAQYCEHCLKEIHEADVTLGRLELMKQSLLRFQNRVYSKLGDNYFQIENRENLNVSYVEFENGGEAMKGRKFSYDEIVKVVYEKLDKDCLKWERFSSEGKPDTTNFSSTSSKVDASSQTDADNMLSKNIVAVGKITNINSSQKTDVISVGPVTEVTVQDTHIEDDSAWSGGEESFAVEDADGGGSDFDASGRGSLSRDPLAIATSRPVVEIDYGPEAKGLPFAKGAINFDEKIYCTFDPENCKRFFYDEYNLKVHIKSFHEGNPLPHECTVCQRGFIDEGRLKNHFLRLHTTSAAFMCDQCGSGFPSPQILREHVRKKHSKEQDHICGFCSAPFSSFDELKDHENLHRSKDNPFACVLCTEICPNSIVLRSHFFSRHSDTAVTCEICGKMLKNESSLKNHMNLHTEQFKCEQCGFAATSNTALKQHVLTHSTEKSHTCAVCGHAFKYAKNLSSHMRVHTGEKPYICSLCGQSFREVAFLRRHEESHSLTDNYKCKVCGAGFKVKENLKKHERTHREDYVPKKKQYKPRTEEQKMRRRLKRQMERYGIVGATTPTKSGTVVKIEADSHVKRTSTKSVSRTVKAAPKRNTRSSLNRSPSKKQSGKKKRSEKTKKKKKQSKRMKKQYSSEEDSADDYEMKDNEGAEDIYEDEGSATYEDLNNQEQKEVLTAVASIQDESVPVVDNSFYQNSVVYTGHFDNSNRINMQHTTFIPVNVVTTQGATTASQLVLRTRQGQHIHGQQQNSMTQVEFL